MVDLLSDEDFKYESVLNGKKFIRKRKINFK